MISVYVLRNKKILLTIGRINSVQFSHVGLFATPGTVASISKYSCVGKRLRKLKPEIERDPKREEGTRSDVQ